MANDVCYCAPETVPLQSWYYSVLKNGCLKHCLYQCSVSNNVCSVSVLLYCRFPDLYGLKSIAAVLRVKGISAYNV